MQNGEERLLSELQQIYLLTSSLGWQIEFEGQLLEEEDGFTHFLP
jgi:hypothetical protein